MYADDDEDGVACYQQYAQCEPMLKDVYQTRFVARDQVDLDGTDSEEDEDMLHPQDESERERFVVPLTGAALTYDSAIPLLAHLCALIPRQPHAPVPMPTYSGEFQSTLHLPSSISLRSRNEPMIGPVKRSKREAKRAVAFHAVKKLYHHKVFDEYLLPISADHNPDYDISANNTEANILSRIPAMMNVNICDPFKVYDAWSYCHTVFIGGRAMASLITGRRLPSFAFFLPKENISVRISTGKKLLFDNLNAVESRALIDGYTRRSIWHICTGRRIELSLGLSAFLVPVTSKGSVTRSPDIKEMTRSLRPHNLFHTSDSNALDLNFHHDLIETIYEGGRTFVITKIRQDLTPYSRTAIGSRYSRLGHQSYGEYFSDRWTRNPKLPPYSPTTFPLIEARRFIKQSSAIYTLAKTQSVDSANTRSGEMISNLRFLNLDEEPFLMPLNTCRKAIFTETMYLAYAMFPKIIHRARDVWRAREARFQLGLPAISDNRLTEALTIPSAAAGYNNQRLETLGK
jgi:endoribonuclease Dicer